MIAERQAKKEQKKLLLGNTRLQKLQVNQQLQGRAEAASQKRLQLARQALVARGQAQASGLGERSVRAINRAIGVRLSADEATITKNHETAKQIALNQINALNISQINGEIAIGDTSDRGLTLGLLGISAEGIGNSIGMSASAAGGGGGAAAAG